MVMGKVHGWNLAIFCDLAPAYLGRYSMAAFRGKLGNGDLVRILALVVIVSLEKTEIVHAGFTETKVAS